MVCITITKHTKNYYLIFFFNLQLLLSHRSAANIYWKGFTGLRVTAAATQFFYHNVKATIDNTYMNRYSVLCSNKISFTKTSSRLNIT